MILELRRIFFRLFPHYRTIEVRAFTYLEADVEIIATAGKPERERWQIARGYEDRNRLPGYVVFLERRERITE